MNFLPISLLSGLLSLFLVGGTLVLARRKGWFDIVDERKTHEGDIPRLGGIGIFWSFVAGLLLYSFGAGQDPRALVEALPVLACFLAVHLLGLVDDFKNLRARWKFLVELACAIAVVAAGHAFTAIALPWGGVLELGIAAYPLTVVWIVGVTNAVNMIDGMDGLSGGISVIAAFSVSMIAMERGAYFPAAAAMILVGSLVGYLFFNFPPAKIFMGDSGSGFLGFVLAVLPLMDRVGVSSGLWFWDAATILLVPIFDVFAAILRRSRAGRSVMSADRWHIHHKLMRLGLDTRSILVVVYAACMALGMVAASSLWLGQSAHLALVLFSWLVFLGLFVVLHVLKSRAAREGGGPERDLGTRGAKE